MKTLEEYWTDTILTEKVQELRDKLPDAFSRFSNADLILAWVKFFGGFSSTWPPATKTKVKKFATHLDIEEIEEEELEEDDEDEEVEIEEVDFDTPRFTDELDYDERDF